MYVLPVLRVPVIKLYEGRGSRVSSTETLGLKVEGGRGAAGEGACECARQPAAGCDLRN